MKLTIETSGSTGRAKSITLDQAKTTTAARNFMCETGLGPRDIILNTMPSHVIGHWAMGVFPAMMMQCTLISIKLNPWTFWEDIKKHRPTIVAQPVGITRSLMKTKGWRDADLSSIRYWITGSGPVDQETMEALKNRGVSKVRNWYGSTEFPPPVMVSDSPSFADFNVMSGYDVGVTEEGRISINSEFTDDYMDGQAMIVPRENLNETWKS